MIAPTRAPVVTTRAPFGPTVRVPTPVIRFTTQKKNRMITASITAASTRGPNPFRSIKALLPSWAEPYRGRAPRTTAGRPRNSPALAHRLLQVLLLVVRAPLAEEFDDLVR